MALMGASGEQHMKTGHGADRNATKRDVHHPASHTGGRSSATQGVLRPLANPPWQSLLKSALGRKRKPLRSYVGFQLEQGARGFSPSHVLFAARGMTATEPGSKWDNSKIHPKGFCFFVCVLFKNLTFLLSLAEQLLDCLISCRAPKWFLAPSSLTCVCG